MKFQSASPCLLPFLGLGWDFPEGEISQVEKDPRTANDLDACMRASKQTDIQ